MSSSSGIMVPRKTSRKTNDQDDISNLPDDVINLILSNLSTVEALAMSVLSKRWKYKWASLYDIEIDDGKRPVPTGESGLIGLLESVTLHMPDVRRASLTLKHKYDSGGLEKFISDLLKRNKVEKLHIDTTQKLFLPDSLLNNTSLKELVLIKGPFFNVYSEHCFLNLTSLCLHDLKINEGVHYTDFLFVTDDQYRDMKFQIHINAPVLEIFKSKTRIKDDDHVPHELEYHTINIHYARLEHLFIGGGEPENFCLTESQVVCASLECHINPSFDGAMMIGLGFRDLLKDIAPALEELVVSVVVAEVINFTAHSPIELPRFNKLRTLSVPCIHYTNIGAVPFEILHATPFLDCLYIDALFEEEYAYEVVDSAPWSSVPWCISNSLETISLYNVKDSTGSFELAEFF